MNIAYETGTLGIRYQQWENVYDRFVYSAANKIESNLISPPGFLFKQFHDRTIYKIYIGMTCNRRFCF